MKFSLLLYGLYVFLRITSWRHPAFKDRLKEKNISMLITTRDGHKGRHFIFKNGSIISKSGHYVNPDASMVFIDTPTAVSILSNKDEAAFMEAITTEKLKFEGDMEIAMWFLETLQMMSSFSGKK